MTPQRRAQFCAYVAEQGLGLVAETPDPDRRRALLAEAFGLRERLAPVLANAPVPPDQQRAEAQENGQIMGLLSYAPSNRIRVAVESGVADEDDVGTLFVADVITRCHVLLDRMKVAPAPGLPPLPIPVFRWRGLTAEQAFAGTPLAPVVARLCMGRPPGDLAGLPLTARGKDGESLLDWALQCRDRAAYTALLAAGHDPDAPGAAGDPPLVRAAGKRDLTYLKALLAKGAKPDAIGTRQSALAAAFTWDKPDGGEAFALLRAAGASLNFPDFDRSVWREWTSRGRWKLVLANLSDFKGDPVGLARWVTMDQEHPGRRTSPELAEVRRRLEADHGVCFPVGAMIDLKKDARGFYIQPDCPKPAPHG
jgi:hypothetical protein